MILRASNPRTCACGRENKRGGSKCSRCYMAVYRKTEKGKRASRKALKRYEQKNPEKRARWVNTYRERVTYYTPPEIHQLRAAIKRIERAVAAAENGTPIHEPSERRCDQAAQRIARFGSGENVQRNCANGGADNHGRSAAGTSGSVSSESHIRRVRR